MFSFSAVIPARPRPSALAFLVLLVVSAVALTAPVALAADPPAQNEVVIKNLFDGTATFTKEDADNPTTGNEGVGKHTPGQDSGPENRVVRTWDIASYGIDWDVNEGAAKNVVLTVKLNGYNKDTANIGWTVDKTGYVPGCIKETFKISDDKQTLTCQLGDDIAQGTHGRIEPLVKLDNGKDTTSWFATVEMTSDTATQTVTSSTEKDPYFVSESPVGNWVKGAPVSKSVPVKDPESGKDGFVVLFPIGMTSGYDAKNPVKGSGKVLNDAPLSFYDHAVGVPDGATLATPSQIKAGGEPGGVAGPNCGALDSSVKTNFPTTEISWTCKSEGSPNGYPVIKMDAPAGYSITAPDKYNNGNSNQAGFVISGQVILWIPRETVTFDPNGNADFSNWITANPPGDKVSASNAQPINVHGSTDVPETSTDDNVTLWAMGDFGVTGGGGGPGTYLSHGTFYTSTYDQVAEIGGKSEEDWQGTPEKPAYWLPMWSARNGAFNGYNAIAGVKTVVSHPIDNPPFSEEHGVDGQGIVHRGETVYMNFHLQAASPDRKVNTPVHGCMTWNSAQVKLQPMPDFTRWTTSHNGSEIYFGTPSKATTSGVGGIGNLLIGSHTGDDMRSNLVQRGPVVQPFSADILAKTGLRVEFAYDPNVNPDNPNDTDPTPTGESGGKFGTYGQQAQNSTECNDAGRTWVDASAVKAGADGLYNYNMVRIRMVGEKPEFPWYNTNRDYYVRGEKKEGSAILLTLKGRVGTDYQGNPTDVNHDNKSLYVHASRSFGEWIGGKPQPFVDKPDGTRKSTCRSTNSYSDIEALEPGGKFNTVDPATSGWCNNVYDPKAEMNSSPGSDPNKTSIPLTAATLYPQMNGNFRDVDTDRVTIKSVKPNVVKTNVNGTSEILDNGQDVTFNFDVSAVGSDTEALTDYTLVDDFPSFDPKTGGITGFYEFKSIAKQPDTKGATCESYPSKNDEPLAPADAVRVKCRFSQADPKNPDSSGLPVGLPGGWSDSIQIVATVKGGVANGNYYNPNRNSTTVNTSQTVTWDPANGGAPAKDAIFVDLKQSANSLGVTYLPLPTDRGAIVKGVDLTNGSCTVGPDGEPLAGDALTAWQERCALVALDEDSSNYTADPPTIDPEGPFDGRMKFSLKYANDGNTRLSNLRIVDVFPWNGDSVEPPSGSASDGADPSTIGDGRSPASKFKGKVGFVGVNGAVDTYVTKDAPGTISRDPKVTVPENVWCTWDAATGTSTGNVEGSKAGDCPKNPYEVTAVYIVGTKEGEQIYPDKSKSFEMVLDTEESSCNSLYTNTFGARVDEIALPIRSNDVSAMTQCPLYNLGNEVWFDPNNNGKIDTGEKPMPGVSMLLFNATAEGTPVDTNKDGKITAADAIGTTKTDAKGLYLFNNLQPGDYIVGVAASNWDPGQPLYSMLSSDPTSNDPNDNVDNDDNGVPRYGMVTSGVVTLGNNAEPTGEDPTNNPLDADGKPVIPDNRSNLTDDFGFYLPQFDLALRKAYVGDNTADTEEIIGTGDDFTFTITVWNQGDVTAENIQVTDYFPPALVLSDPDWTLQATGLATINIPGPLEPGQKTAVDITFNAPVFVAGDIENSAEISKATPIDVEGKPILTPTGKEIVDIDSVADQILGNDKTINNRVDLTPLTGDEDDEDFSLIQMLDLPGSPSIPPSKTPDVPGLPRTGFGGFAPGVLAALLLLAGASLVVAGRRRWGKSTGERL